MKICAPSRDSRGLDGAPHGHFGSASFFVVHDTATGETETIDDANQHHAHGMCHPVGALGGRNIDAIVVRGIGARALMMLQAAGMRSYRAEPGSIRENIELLAKGRLAELAVENSCGRRGHGCHSE